MSGIDIALALIILLGAYRGFKQGFLMELFSLAAIILGVLGGFKLMGLAMIYLTERFNIDEKVLPYISFAVVFIIIVIVVSMVGRILKASIDQSFLGRIDQAAGGLLGIVKTAFILSVAVWLLDSLKFNLPSTWTDNSKLFPFIANIAPVITSWIAKVVPAFKDIF